MPKFKFKNDYTVHMPIDYKIYYKLATKAIDSAMIGIDSLVSGNYRPPAFAYARPGSSAGVRPNPEQYARRAELPSIDAYVRDSSTSKQAMNTPTAREMLHRLLNYF